MASTPSSSFTASQPGMASEFDKDTVQTQMRLAQAKDFIKQESKRLSGTAKGLQDENTVLQRNLDDTRAAVLKPEICDTLSQAPIRCLPIPSPAFFDNMVPYLADYVESYDAEHHKDSNFVTIWNGFSRIQAQENGLTQTTQLIKSLVSDNYHLRKENIKLATGEQRTKYEAVLGGPTHPDMFFRQVPFYVSSDEPIHQFDKLESLCEFQKMTGTKDLVLEEGLVNVIGCEAMAYHPLSTVYVPPFPGQGISTTAHSIQAAEAITFYDLDHFLCIETPSGARLWVRKTGKSGVWVFP